MKSLQYAQDYDSALVSKYLDVCIFTYNLDESHLNDRYHNVCRKKEKVLVLYCGQGNSKHYKTFKVKYGYEIDNQGNVASIIDGQNGSVPINDGF